MKYKIDFLKIAKKRVKICMYSIFCAAFYRQTIIESNRSLTSTQQKEAQHKYTGWSRSIDKEQGLKHSRPSNSQPIGETGLEPAWPTSPTQAKQGGLETILRTYPLASKALV